MPPLLEPFILNNLNASCICYYQGSQILEYVSSILLCVQVLDDIPTTWFVVTGCFNFTCVSMPGVTLAVWCPHPSLVTGILSSTKNWRLTHRRRADTLSSSAMASILIMQIVTKRDFLRVWVSCYIVQGFSPVSVCCCMIDCIRFLNSFNELLIDWLYEIFQQFGLLHDWLYEVSQQFGLLHDWLYIRFINGFRCCLIDWVSVVAWLILWGFTTICLSCCMIDCMRFLSSLSCWMIYCIRFLKSLGFASIFLRVF